MFKRLKIMVDKNYVENIIKYPPIEKKREIDAVDILVALAMKKES